MIAAITAVTSSFVILSTLMASKFNDWTVTIYTNKFNEGSIEIVIYSLIFAIVLINLYQEMKIMRRKMHAFKRNSRN